MKRITAVFFRFTVFFLDLFEKSLPGNGSGGGNGTGGGQSGGAGI